ncbi:MAG: ankyrin repeat domain-containing protein [Planctomycetaceae bacterium]
MSDDDSRVRMAEAIFEGDLQRVRAIVAASPEELHREFLIGNWAFDAARDGKTDIVKFLLKSGLDVNYQSQAGRSTVLCAAIDFDHYETAEAILKLGADPNLERPLIAAIRRRSPELRLRLVQLLVEHGADVNRLYDVYGDTSNLFSALDWVEDDACRKYLLEAGAKTSKQLIAEGRKFGEVYSKDGKLLRAADGSLPGQPASKSLTDEIVEHFVKSIGPTEEKSLIEIVPGETPIAIHSIPATKDRPYVTLFTTGLSSKPMNVPEGEEEYRFAELFIQLPANWQYKNLTDRNWSWPVHQ